MASTRSREDLLAMLDLGVREASASFRVGTEAVADGLRKVVQTATTSTTSTAKPAQKKETRAQPQANPEKPFLDIVDVTSA